MLRMPHPKSRYWKRSALQRVIALSVLEMGAVLETKTPRLLRAAQLVLILFFIVLLTKL